MKKLFVLGFILLLIGCKTKQKTVEAPALPAMSVISSTEVAPSLKTKAYSLGKRVLMTCNTSRFKPFTTEEATASVIQNTTAERLSKVCHKFRVKYGDFKEIELAEVLKNNRDGSYIFRYKARYERDFAKKELRVTMDKNQKVSAIKSTDWVDKLY
ncbi:hypothetical protein FLAN108750_10190 [Flavobacterium antarcticum]|uniref:hypothetical protein n=1 Tax=Flavobacterium antarcticum TaxID=271155 RepID=UPI0003B3C13C|nr:hypothetical protein [Flavobacterium antarcticum]